MLNTCQRNSVPGFAFNMSNSSGCWKSCLVQPGIQKLHREIRHTTASSLLVLHAFIFHLVQPGIRSWKSRRPIHGLDQEIRHTSASSLLVLSYTYVNIKILRALECNLFCPLGSNLSHFLDYLMQVRLTLRHHTLPSPTTTNTSGPFMQHPTNT